MASNLTLNMGDAAYAASLADGVSTGGGAGVKKPPPPEKVALRRGKWTIEEEQFALRLIEEFRAGLLPLTDGTTLRTFLSKLLNCDPMRISKKFVGDNCIGKQVFRHASGEMNGFISAERMEKSKRELAELERKFLDRLMSSSTTPTASPRSSDSTSGERKPKKAKMSVKAEDVHSKVGYNSGLDDHGGMGYDSTYMQHPSHTNPQHRQQQPFVNQHPNDSIHYSSGMGNGLDSRGLSPNNYPPIPPSSLSGYSGHDSHSTQYMNPQTGYPYPPVRTSSDSSNGGGYEDWRQQQLRNGPFDAQLNWHNQYLPSQQFFDQHQSQLRSGNPGDQSEEGLLKAKGSFYKSIKSSSTSSLDLLGTLATSISRENLVSYGTSGDSSMNLSAMGGTDNTPASVNSSGISRSDHSNNLKRNSKSIQDFWMLVEMGDLSRPDNEDIDINDEDDVHAAVFDIEDDKSNPTISSLSGKSNSGAKRDETLSAGAPLPVSRCESAPSLSVNTLSTLTSGGGSAGNGAGNVHPIKATGSSYSNVGSAQQGGAKDSKHEHVIMESLLSIASAENSRIDELNAHSPAFPSVEKSTTTGGDKKM